MGGEERLPVENPNPDSSVRWYPFSGSSDHQSMPVNHHGWRHCVGDHHYIIGL